VHVVKEDGTPAKPLELGRIVAKLPTPPGFMQTLYKAEDRFKLEYFGKYDVNFK
jgi:propionyl-CoA synthetase